MLDSEFMRTVRSGAARTLVGLALLGTSGCLFLSPDDESAGVRIEMIARAEREGVLAKAAVDPIEVLASDELTGRAILSRTAPNSDAVESIEFPLTVGPLVAGERTVTGVVDFNLGPVGSTYALQAELLYLGVEQAGTPDALNPAGSWQGEIGFDAGDLNVQVESMSLLPTGTPNTFSGFIRLTHPSLDNQEIPSVALSGVVFDPATGSIDMSYLAPELVQWDESTAELEVIRVRFDGQFAPTVAFVRDPQESLEVDLTPGGGVIEVELVPVPGGIVIGRRIVGTLQVSVHENDGSGQPGAVILAEEGSVVVTRPAPAIDR